MPLPESLLKPEAYPFSVKNIKLCETHISWVFLAGKFAYKVKKPAKFSFLDFSSLASRKKFCEREVRLNRRLAEELYLGVVPIAEINGALFLEGKGKPVEFAVKMRRLEEKEHLSALLAHGNVPPKSMAALGALVGKFHKKERPMRKKGYGEPFRLRSFFNDLVSVRGPVQDALGLGFLVDSLIAWSDGFLSANQALFLQRKKEGKVKVCHGDLHSGNVFLGKRPVVFDCIEFNDDFTHLDQTADVAFFTMDLAFHKRKELGEIFLANYLKANPDSTLLQVLPWYQAYYANVRAKVAALTAHHLKGEAREKKWEECAAYLELARSLSGA